MVTVLLEYILLIKPFWHLATYTLFSYAGVKHLSKIYNTFQAGLGLQLRAYNDAYVATIYKNY